MRWIFRNFFIELVAVYFTTQIATGIIFENYAEGLVITSFALALANKLIKPIVGILLLPLTLATLGLFRFITHAITLYIVDTAMSQFQITGFQFAGFTSTYLDIPAMQYGPGVLSYLAFSTVISVSFMVLHWAFN